MAHALEIKADGKASMFSGEGKTPWHGLGEVVSGLATAAEALEYAGLDWTVEKQPIFFGEQFNGFPGRFATVRTSDQKPLGIVSDGYHIFQNVEAFDFFDAVTDHGTGEAHYTAAGSLFGGQRVFLTAKIGDTFEVAGQDAHDMYLLITNSHDGTQAFTAAITTIRAVCNNTVTLGLNSAKTKWSIRHKSSLEGKVHEARESLMMSYKYRDAFQEEVEKMMAVQVNKDQFKKIIEGIVPPSKFQHDKAVAGMMDVFENEPTVINTEANGTGYGAYNAVTFWSDWVRNYQTTDSRFKSLVGGGIAETLRDKMHSKVLALG
jgi:phage/plasmid-like protein (TIGR03299 family)